LALADEAWRLTTASVTDDEAQIQALQEHANAVMSSLLTRYSKPSLF
jgi:hypothetical protein